jgi:cell division septum initiation protein DivIVA
MDGSGTIYLKTVNFGGFEKNGVLQYVDELNTKIFSLEAELDEKKTLLASAGDASAGSEKYEELLRIDKTKIAELQTANNSINIQYQSALEEMSQKDAEIEALKNKTSALEDELADAKRKAAAGSMESSAMDLGAVFMEAQKSASLIVTQAKENARKMDEDAKKLANQVVDDANGKASTIVKKADETASRILTDTERKIADLRAQADHVKSSVEKQVGDLDFNITKLRSVIESFSADSTAKLTETKTIIERAQNLINAEDETEAYINSTIKRAPPPKFGNQASYRSDNDSEPSERRRSEPKPEPEAPPERKSRPEPKSEPKAETRPEPKQEPAKKQPPKPASKFGFDLSELESLSKLVEGSAGNDNY